MQSSRFSFLLLVHKELRLFLKGDGKDQPGEITEYAGVTIDWIRGRKAVMTVYDDSGKPQGEPIQLYELQTREQMHQLMIDKGFHKKSQKESIQELQVEQREKQLKQLGDGTSLYGRQMGIYFVVLLVIGSIGVFFISGKRKKTRSSIAHSALVSRV